VTTLAGAEGVAGFVDGAAADARFNRPAGLYNDGAGTLWLADEGNAVVRSVALATGAVATVLGANSAGSLDGTGHEARLFAAPGDKFSRFKTPAGLALDGGRLFVADVGSHVIVAIDLAKRQATLFAGQDGVAGNADGTGVHAGFYGPQALVSDGRGHLYVSD